MIPVLALLGVLAAGCGGQDEGAGEAELAFQAAGEPVAEVPICIEVDQMLGTPSLPDSAVIGGASVSLADLFPAPFAVYVGHSDADLPAVVPVFKADLFSWRRDYADYAFPVPCAAQVWALVALQESDPGLHGELFAEGTRRGLVVFTNDLPVDQDTADAELLRRFAHELLHALNVHHEDYDDDNGPPPSGFYRAGTVESYSPIESLRWSLGSRTMQHLLHHPRSVVLPNTGYAFGKVVGTHLDAHPANWASYLRVDPSDPPLGEDAPALGTPQASADAGVSSLLRLRLEGLPSVERGVPVVVQAVVENLGSDFEGPLLLDPSYGFLRLEVEPPEGELRPFVPLMVGDHFGPLTADRGLAAGERRAVPVDLFYGSAGWTFPQAGTYTVRATYDFADGVHPPLVAEPLRLRVEAIEGDRLESFRSVSAGDLQETEDLGRFLLLRGGPRSSEARQRLERFVREQPGTPQAEWFNLALALDALRPTVEAGVRPPADTARAEALLDGLLDRETIEQLPSRDLLNAHLALSSALEGEGLVDRALAVRQKVLEAVPDEELRRLDQDGALLFEWDKTKSLIELTPTERNRLLEAGARGFLSQEEQQ